MKQDVATIAKAIPRTNRIHYSDDVKAIMSNHSRILGADIIPMESAMRVVQITNLYLRDSDLEVYLDQFVVWLDVYEIIDAFVRLLPNE